MGSTLSDVADHRCFSFLVMMMMMMMMMIIRFSMFFEHMISREEQGALGTHGMEKRRGSYFHQNYRVSQDDEMFEEHAC